MCVVCVCLNVYVHIAFKTRNHTEKTHEKRGGGIFVHLASDIKTCYKLLLCVVLFQISIHYVTIFLELSLDGTLLDECLYYSSSNSIINTTEQFF